MASRKIISIIVLSMLLMIYLPINVNLGIHRNTLYLYSLSSQLNIGNLTSRLNKVRLEQIEDQIELEPIASSPGIKAVGLDNETGELVISFKSGVLCTRNLKAISIDKNFGVFWNIFDLPGKGKVGLYFMETTTFYYIDCNNGTYETFSLGPPGNQNPYELYLWNNYLILTHYRSNNSLTGNIVDVLFIENKTIIANYTIVADRYFPPLKFGYDNNFLLLYFPYNYTTSYILVFNNEGRLIFNKTISIEYVDSAYGLRNVPGVVLVETNFTERRISLSAYIYDNGTLSRSSFIIPGNYTVIKTKMLGNSRLLLLLNNTVNRDLVVKWIRFNGSSFSIIKDIDLGTKWGYNIYVHEYSKENVVVIQKNPLENTTYIVLGSDGVIANITDKRLNGTIIYKAYYLPDTNTVLFNLYTYNSSPILYIRDLDTGKSRLLYASYLQEIYGNIIYLANVGIYIVKDNATIELYQPYFRIAIGILPINENLIARVVVGTDGYIDLELIDNKLNVLKTVKITKATPTVLFDYDYVFAYLTYTNNTIYIFLSQPSGFLPSIECYMYNMNSEEIVKIENCSMPLPIIINYLAPGNGVIVLDYPSISFIGIEHEGKLYISSPTLKIWPDSSNTSILTGKNSTKLAIYHKNETAFSLLVFRGNKLIYRSMVSAYPLTWIYNDTYLLVYHELKREIIVLDDNAKIKYTSGNAIGLLPGRNFIGWLYTNGTIISISDNGVYKYNNYTQAVSSPYSDYILAEKNNTLYSLHEGKETIIGKLPQNNTYILMETSIPYVYGKTTGLFYLINISLIYNQTITEHYKWQIIPEIPLNLSIVYKPPYHVDQCIWKSTTIRLIGEQPLPANYTVNITIYYRNGTTATRNLILDSRLTTIPINKQIQELTGVLLKAKNAQGIFIPAACPATDYRLLNSTQRIDFSPISAYIYKNETVIKLKYWVQVEHSLSLEFGTSQDTWNLLILLRALTLYVYPNYTITADAKAAQLTIREESMDKNITILFNTSFASYGKKLFLKIENKGETLAITLPYLGNNRYNLSFNFDPPKIAIYNESIYLGTVNEIPVQLVIRGEIFLPLENFEKNITINAKMLEEPETTTTHQEYISHHSTNTSISKQSITNTTSTPTGNRTGFQKRISVVVVIILIMVGLVLFLKKK